jgi:hypothetical protein
MLSSMCVVVRCSRLTDVELLDNLLLLLVAGHDTSSSTLTLALANLQQHPEVRRGAGEGGSTSAWCQLSYSAPLCMGTNRQSCICYQLLPIAWLLHEMPLALAQRRW